MRRLIGRLGVTTAVPPEQGAPPFALYLPQIAMPHQVNLPKIVMILEKRASSWQAQSLE
jgi:hypothetical protein